MNLLAKNPANYRRVGLIGMVMLALLGGFITATSAFPFGANTYTAVLEHTAGLRAGEEVQVAGVGVGDVRKVSLGEHQVLVEFTVDKDVHLGADTTAEVKVATLLGTHFLLISPKGGGELPGDTIPMAHTRVPFNLQDVINETGTLSENLDVDKISQALTQIAATMDQTRDEFVPALKGLSRLSQMFAVRSDDIGRLLRSTSKVTGQLARSSDDIVGLMKAANVILADLVQRKTAVHRLLVDLRTIGEELSAVMVENREDVGPMLENLSGTIGVLVKNETSLAGLIDQLGPLVRYFANSTGNGSWVELYLAGGVPDNLRCLTEGRCA